MCHLGSIVTSDAHGELLMGYLLSPVTTSMTDFGGGCPANVVLHEVDTMGCFRWEGEFRGLPLTLGLQLS